MAIENKKRVFSGVQPTGKLHIGNYLGAIKSWVDNQDLYENIFCIVDLHALTIPESIDPKVLKSKLRELAGLYIACGIDPEKSSIFIQSNVSAHSELAWLLNCVTPMGWLERMTQYKSKSKLVESLGTGLFDYPVLQAADILLYDTNFVPVGADQVQHIELTRDIAKRFNNLFGEVFVMPEPLLGKSGSRIMGLDEPETKMSKSIGEKRDGHSIGLLDSEKSIKKAIMRSVTDSNAETRFEHACPGVLNLLTIYEVFSGKSKAEIEAHFEGKGYGFLKKELLSIVLDSLKPIQENFNYIMSNGDYLEQVLKASTDKVNAIATNKMEQVKSALGIG